MVMGVEVVVACVLVVVVVVLVLVVFVVVVAVAVVVVMVLLFAVWMLAVSGGGCVVVGGEVFTKVVWVVVAWISLIVGRGGWSWS